MQFFALALLLASVLSAGSVRSQPVAAAPSVPQSKEQVSLSFAPLVRQVAPAVVNIYTTRKVQQRLSPLFDDPFFSQFFAGGLPRGMERERVENSLGSGVIVNEDGLIVTSNHVIEGADQIRVVLADHREFDAAVVLSDHHSDLAVLKVTLANAHLPYLELRDSDTAEVGDLVLAIGDPFAVGQTVTSGIISAMAHGAVGNSDLGYFIQTDAAINPGNSGGALVTMDGKLVGINSSIYSRSGGNLGIGFAVPSNMVRVLVAAAAGGKTAITRPWLGIDGQDITPELATSLNIAEPYGFLVNKLNAHSPAALSGIMLGDVVIAVNGRIVEDDNAFHYRINTLAAGSKVDLTVLRKGTKLDVTVELTVPPEVPPRDKMEVTGANPFAGATVENISPAVMEELGSVASDHGVVVVAVGDRTPAAHLGLQKNDILLGFNGMKFESVDDVRRLSKLDASRWRISIQRGSEVLTVLVGQ